MPQVSIMASLPRGIDGSSAPGWLLALCWVQALCFARNRGSLVSACVQHVICLLLVGFACLKTSEEGQGNKALCFFYAYVHSPVLSLVICFQVGIGFHVDRACRHSPIQVCTHTVTNFLRPCVLPLCLVPLQGTAGGLPETGCHGGCHSRRVGGADCCPGWRREAKLY